MLYIYFLPSPVRETDDLNDGPKHHMPLTIDCQSKVRIQPHQCRVRKNATLASSVIASQQQRVRFVIQRADHRPDTQRTEGSVFVSTLPGHAELPLAGLPQPNVAPAQHWAKSRLLTKKTARVPSQVIHHVHNVTHPNVHCQKEQQPCQVFARILNIDRLSQALARARSIRRAQVSVRN